MHNVLVIRLPISPIIYCFSNAINWQFNNKIIN